MRPKYNKKHEQKKYVRRLLQEFEPRIERIKYQLYPTYPSLILHLLLF